MSIINRTTQARAAYAERLCGHSSRSCLKRLAPIFIVLFLAASVITGCADAAEPTADLGNCPIKTEEPASAEHSYDYKEKTYYFCCQSCVLDFKSDPDRFVVPATSDNLIENTTRVTPEYPPLPATEFGRLLWLLNRPTVAVHFVATISLLVLWMLRSRLSNKVWGCILGLGIIDVVFLVGSLAMRDYQGATQQATPAAVEPVNTLPTTRQLVTLEESIHYTTLQKFGRPVRPVRLSEKPPSLSSTYYRGNDERSSDLLNNGNYRTATIQTMLTADGANEVEYHDKIASERLAIRIIIDRGPGTSNGYFTEDYMQRMYLTQSSDPTMGSTAPVPDRVPLVMTQPEKQWEATFPIGIRAASDNDHLTGVVYVCEERYSTARNELLGGRFHYAIEYDLHIQDGHIQLPSDVWMGATYEGEQYDVMDLSHEEWLSLDPLPELPASGQ